MLFDQLNELANKALDSAKDKAEWRRCSMLWLRHLRQELKLSPVAYKIRFNPGGIAVAGDPSMHGPDVAVYLTGFGDQVGYARGVEDAKDHTGGQNHWFPSSADHDHAVRVVRMALQQGKKMRGSASTKISSLEVI